MIRILVRQIRFPGLLRAVIEASLFGVVFLACGHVSLGYPIEDMLMPMVPAVLVMMLGMVCSGVYRREITNSIMNIYAHAAFGFLLAAIGFVLMVHILMPEFANARFVFFFLLFAYFAFNTVSPLVSGTDFVDGGGRRKN